ncbi:hypothetical protein [Flavobacterium sp. UBA7663]|uniref:hypothetical protein n=1 Tax=Flavobacterium sp. UBA7663 TaxID=1946557 RepID=UPI0025BCB775|nr:hypothetical protein [Flavobacterium sp. UBA7663]
MNNLKIFLLLLLYNTCFSQVINPAIKTIDTSKVAILPFEKNSKTYFKNCTESKLSIDELLYAENELVKKVNKYNKREKRNPTIHFGTDYIDLEKYHRQYLVYINKNGQKEVYVNCFCEEPAENWRDYLADVDDGGNCFLQLKINLTKKKVGQLETN